MENENKKKQATIKENPYLRDHSNDPFIKRKMEKGEAILKNLKNPLS
jgi:hypothetical protein